MQAVGSCLCVGVDPDPGTMPRGMARDVRGIERFARMVLEAALPFAAAVKLNLAFFEAWGSEGIAALERLRAAVPADVPFIADAKRGDIPSTAAHQAVALFDSLGADAVTANPYLGLDAVLPLVERSDRFVYVVCRTSNAGAGEIQDLAVDGEPLHVRVARRVAVWRADYPRLGLVAGATAPSQLAAIRAAAPGLPMLVPGLGAQGGTLPPVLEHGPAQAPPAARLPAGGLLVNVSRSIAAAGMDTDEPEQRIAAAARDWSARLRIAEGQVLR
jgi:orotidine-5'-phosphate decarboxylase